VERGWGWGLWAYVLALSAHNVTSHAVRHPAPAPSPLRRNPGFEYSFSDTSNHTLFFNICGNVSTLCAPKFPLYDSIGVAVQKWGSDPTPCDNSCTNWDTGAPVCCTSDCAVLGTEFFQFQLLDPNNQNGGVQFVHTGMPPE
jgi:hypothetical protein